MYVAVNFYSNFVYPHPYVMTTPKCCFISNNIDGKYKITILNFESY